MTYGLPVRQLNGVNRPKKKGGKKEGEEAGEDWYRDSSYPPFLLITEATTSYAAGLGLENRVYTEDRELRHIFTFSYVTCAPFSMEMVERSIKCITLGNSIHVSGHNWGALKSA